MKGTTLLIVEDEKKIRMLLADYFKAENFNVFLLDRGDLVPEFLAGTPVDLLLLDIMLPGLDGTHLLKNIRKTSNIPVIMLTARVEETDILTGLELGADDYICKPFSPREVVARVKTVLRRSKKDRFVKEIRTNCLTLNLESLEVTVDHEKLAVTPNEYGILKTLMMQPNKTFTRDELVSAVQGYQSGSYHRTIDTHIKNLRKKIAHIRPDRKIILSVYGKGYKINRDDP